MFVGKAASRRGDVKMCVSLGILTELGGYGCSYIVVITDNTHGV